VPARADDDRCQSDVRVDWRTARPETPPWRVRKSLGDTPLDVSSAPNGPVTVAVTLFTNSSVVRLCGQFSSCVYTVLSGGRGYKLACKTGSAGGAGVKRPFRVSTMSVYLPSTSIVCHRVQPQMPSEKRQRCWVDVDAVEASAPGSLVGKPITIELYLSGTVNSGTYVGSLRVRMDK
jgi:hypothetical protein